MPRLNAILSDAEASLVLTTTALLPKIEGWLTQGGTDHEVNLQASDAVSDELAAQWREPRLDPQAVAFLQYTSGSTATPRGVMVSHDNLLANLASMQERARMSSDNISVSWLPHFHDMGLLYGILLPFYSDHPAYLMAPLTFLQRPRRWLEAITQFRGTHTAGPNFAYESCVENTAPRERESLELSCWRVAVNGAEPMRAETLERFAEAFGPCGFRTETAMPGYGLAEATLVVSGTLAGVDPVVQSVDARALEVGRISPVDDGRGTRRLVSSGRLADGVRVVIVDPGTGKACSSDRIGEIWVSGRSVTLGYWQQPEATAESYGAYLTDTREGPFLRTGDLGFLREDGELFVTGRIKDLIIVSGTNHYPQDIEHTVERAHPALQPHAGTAFSIHDEREERLHVVQEVHRSRRRDLDVDGIFEAARRAVAREHDLELDTLVLIGPGRLPRASSGKVQRGACRAKLLEGGFKELGRRSRHATRGTPESTAPSQSGPPDAPAHHSAPAIRDWLVRAVSERLGLSPAAVEVTIPLADFGLVSKDMVALAGNLEAWLGREVPPTLVYDHPSIEALSRHLGGVNERRSTQAAVRARADSADEPIAIVGMGCRFPGADAPDEFWNVLHGGVDTISEVPPSRWDITVSSDSNGVDGAETISHWGGFLQDVDQFDPEFFGIAPREARGMDPQQRLLLEVVWEAFENAGATLERLAGSMTGVFVGISSWDYATLQAASSSFDDAYAGTGNASSIAANRISYQLDLKGPSWAVDTACSSSLVAVAQACQSLRQGACQLAVAGGVNLMLAPNLTQTFSRAGMMAADGRCKAFDAAADGYVRGEGCGVVVLKRLSDALAEGNRIHAMIRGEAVNQDGRSNGLTAPSGLAQEAVIRQALDVAGVAPAQIHYIEAHGTGTELGDPIELSALRRVLGVRGAAEPPCWVGSVKTNIGHLEAAAGIAGLIKVALSLEHETIPPHLHFHRPTPQVDWEHLPLSVPIQPTPWPRSERPRVAGVSSSGFGGTNAHLIVEEALAVERDQAAQGRPLHLLKLSAKSEAALGALAECYARFLGSANGASVADVCYFANTGRSDFEHRLTVYGRTGEAMRERLASFVTRAGVSRDARCLRRGAARRARAAVAGGDVRRRGRAAGGVARRDVLHAAGAVCAGVRAGGDVAFMGRGACGGAGAQRRRVRGGMRGGGVRTGGCAAVDCGARAADAGAVARGGDGGGVCRGVAGHGAARRA
jgi:acyl-CoA synthetase (AMP-forming)/AMP-acid ligase II/3-oxoacyl-(acyl-carrier-protein) synthase